MITIIKQILFWILSFTWGILQTLYGCIVALFLLFVGVKPRHFYQNIYFEIGEGWGGLEAGPFFLVDRGATLYLKQHEAGHGIQNIIFGPLTPFLITIPSAVRYWLRTFKEQKGKYVFSSILSLVVLIVGLALFIPGCIKLIIPLIVIGAFIIAYIGIIFIWLVAKEIPQYKEFTPMYDDIWFEKQASAFGEKYYIMDDIS